MSKLPFLLVLLLAGAEGQDDRPSAQPNTALINEYAGTSNGDLKKALELASAGKYVEALAIYDEALENRTNAVVTLAGDRSRAWGVRDYVLDQIASWPEEGRAAYRRRTDPLAEHLFQGAKRARDVDALEALIEQYPLGTVVNDALALIANIRLDAGENEAAAQALSRLLERDGGPDPAILVARLGLAWARAGRKPAIEELIRRAERDYPGAAVQAGERKVALSDYLKELAAAAPERPADAAPLALPAWEMIGGGPTGSRLAESGVELSRLAWMDTIGLPRLEGEDELVMRRSMALSLTPDFRPLFPAVSDGILYVHNGIAVTAYNLFARQAEKLWQFRVPTPSGEVMFDDRLIYAPLVHEGRVFANLISSVGGEENQLGYVRVKFPFPRRALFAFDAYTGKLLWKVGGRLLAESLEENATFATAPTPDGSRLYVGAVRQKLSTDPFQHYVLCLDAATGRILWSTYVASGGTEINLFGNSTRESLGTPVAVTEDSVFYGTNHGIVAALDRKSGRLRWTYRYTQLPVRPTRSVYVSKNALQWVNSPPLVARGLVVMSPTDSQYLYALDAARGKLRWMRPRGQEVRTIYGARETTLVLGGERLELCDLMTGQPISPPSGDELHGSGRGVVAADGIYVPCQDKLRKVNWDGTWDESSARRWAGGLGDGGNLVIVDGAVVLATQDSVQVFFDRRDQERSIVEALERNPDDPTVLYRGGLRYLQSGDPQRASQLLARVVERTARSPRPEDERLHRAARKRLFSVSMEAGRADLEAGDPAKAADQFAAARKYAAEVPAQVEASVQLARAHLVRKDDAAAVGEYQRLLLDHGQDTVEGTRVFDLARNAIAAVLTTVGRTPYAPHEAAAARLLADARRDGTADAFQKVFRLYPNSAAAEEALFEAASVQERLKRTPEQITILRQFLREYSESSRAPEAHATLVRALEDKGYLASAGALLRRMIRLYPDAPIRDGDAKVPAREFAERRLKTERYAKPAHVTPLAKLSPPFEDKNTLVITEKNFPEGAMLRTIGAPPPGAEKILLMQYAAPGTSAVKALDAATGRELWKIALESTVRFAAFVEESLLLADERTVLRLDPRTGVESWPRYVSKVRMRGFGLAGPMLLCVVDEPESHLVALDTLRGAITWSQPFEGTASSRVFASGENVVFTTVSPNRIQLFEAETGKRLLQEAAFTKYTNQIVHVSDDLLVVHVGVLGGESKFLEAYDLPAGTLRWRAPLDRTSTRGLEVGPDVLVLLVSQRPASGIDEKIFVRMINLRTGKNVKEREPKDLGDPRFMLLDGDQVVVVSREAGNLSVRGLSLSDFTVRWTTPLGGKEATLLPPALTQNHVVVGAFEGNPDTKYRYAAWLLDKSGKLVQPTIASKFEFDVPPEFGVAHDRLIFSVQNRVDVHH